jgi:Mg-chelatase subunit ChlD
MKQFALIFTVFTAIPRIIYAQTADPNLHRRSLVFDVNKQVSSDDGKDKADKVYNAAKGGKGTSVSSEGKSGKSTKAQKAKQHSSKSGSGFLSISMNGVDVSPCNDEQKNQLNICLALDMSGSLCNQGKFGDCMGSDGNNPCDICRDYDFPVETCCKNFASVREFSMSIVSSLLKETSPGTLFSVVAFSSDARVASGLSSGDATLSTLSVLAYSGGLTNHESAIQQCQDTFSSSSSEKRKNTILLITDGVSTKPYFDPFGRAEAAAKTAKDEGTTIIPIFISSDDKSSDLEFMSRLSSSGEVVKVSDFGGLASIQESLVNEVEDVACNK